ncbi:MAG: hypothetical protein U0935_06770 [Pirellulales bacterium]
MSSLYSDHSDLLPTHRSTLRERRIRHVAWVTSAALHVVAFVGIACAQPVIWLLFGPPLPAPRTIQLVARGPEDLRPSPDPLLEYAISQAPPSDDSAANTSANPVAAEPAPSAREDAPTDALLNPAAIVQRRVDRAIRDAQELNSDQQFAQLEQLSDQLRDTSSSESLDQLTGQLQRLLGTAPRATAPAAEPVEGPFDSETAQVHDVRRVESDDGSVRYVAILVDAAGRSSEVELDEETGAQLARTFELIKSNPLLEKVYRGVVMALMDKLLRPMDNAEIPPLPATPGPP